MNSSSISTIGSYNGSFTEDSDSKTDEDDDDDGDGDDDGSEWSDGKGGNDIGDCSDNEGNVTCILNKGLLEEVDDEAEFASNLIVNNELAVTSDVVVNSKLIVNSTCINNEYFVDCVDQEGYDASMIATEEPNDDTFDDCDSDWVDCDDYKDPDYVPTGDVDISSDEFDDEVVSFKERLLNNRMFFVFESKLYELLKYCPKCSNGLDKSLIEDVKNEGSQVHLKLNCLNGCKFE